MISVNLCELLSKNTISRYNIWGMLDSSLLTVEKVSRLYFGSYFCSQYFLQMDFTAELFSFCSKRNLRLSMVLPVFSQKDIALGKVAIERFLLESAGLIDEITVNDPGMLEFVKQSYNGLKINLGRLFFKDVRDARLADLSQRHIIPVGIGSFSECINYKDINSIELDIISKNMDFDKEFDISMVAIHTPLSYMTTGNICKFASIHKSIEHKFRPNAPCCMECSYVYEYNTHILDGRTTEFYRIGRTVYANCPEFESATFYANRLIYWPIQELIEVGLQNNS